MVVMFGNTLEQESRSLKTTEVAPKLLGTSPQFLKLGGKINEFSVPNHVSASPFQLCSLKFKNSTALHDCIRSFQIIDGHSGLYLPAFSCRQ